MDCSPSELIADRNLAVLQNVDRGCDELIHPVLDLLQALVQLELRDDVLVHVGYAEDEASDQRQEAHALKLALSMKRNV